MVPLLLEEKNVWKLVDRMVEMAAKAVPFI
jgi:hypothetical protein